MEIVYEKIENNVVVDSIVADAAFIATLPNAAAWTLQVTPEVVPPTAEETAREWRDRELSNTDFWVPTTDHPQYSDRMAYRVSLRDWPSTSDFPATKPTL
ncbi:phage tail assembly chaperone [bacterium]|nr:phage tail assembly chaperone [bacterium]